MIRLCVCVGVGIFTDVIIIHSVTFMNIWTCIKCACDTHPRGKWHYTYLSVFDDTKLPIVMNTVWFTCDVCKSFDSSCRIRDFNILLHMPFQKAMYITWSSIMRTRSGMWHLKISKFECYVLVVFFVCSDENQAQFWSIISKFKGNI